MSRDAVLLLALGLFLGGAEEAKSFGLLKAFLSPEARFIRVRSFDEASRFRSATDELRLDFVGLVQQHGYPAEEHYTRTEDGYNLVIHRIPASPMSPRAKKKPIVFLQHGVIASADTWVLLGPGKDLAFLMADAGYDVWIGNCRGNTYSRSHVTLSPSDPKFWDFSYHEIGYYDLPAMVDHILAETGQKRLTYIGHSMGTTCSYVMLSMRPEYNDLFRLVISLAPVAYWRHEFNHFFKLALENGRTIENILRINGIHELTPQSTFYTEIIDAFCRDELVTQATCLQLLFLATGSDITQFNTTLLPHFANYFPAGMSVRTLLHYYQNAVTGEFRQFDYDDFDHCARYEMNCPPSYDMSKVTAPVALFYGPNDPISQEKDTKDLAMILPNVVVREPVVWRFFNHLDFLWAINARLFIYDKLIDLMNKFRGK